MACLFVNYFASVFDPSVPSNICPNQMCDGIIEDIVVTPAMVAVAINTLDPNSSMGIDGIHPRLLTKLSDELSVPLSIIFNVSLSDGSLPHE